MVYSLHSFLRPSFVLLATLCRLLALHGAMYTWKPLVSNFFRSLFKLFQVYLRVMLLIVYQPALFVFRFYLLGTRLLRFPFNEAGRICRVKARS